MALQFYNGEKWVTVNDCVIEEFLQKHHSIENISRELQQPVRVLDADEIAVWEFHPGDE